MRISDWSSDVCSSDLDLEDRHDRQNGNESDFRGRQSARFLHFTDCLSSQCAYGHSHHDRRVKARQHRAHGDMDVSNRNGEYRYGSQTGRQSEPAEIRTEEHTSELQSLMRLSYAYFCL